MVIVCRITDVLLTSLHVLKTLNIDYMYIFCTCSLYFKTFSAILISRVDHKDPLVLFQQTCKRVSFFPISVELDLSYGA